MNKVCQHCGKIFLGYHSAKYCSNECRDAAMTAVCPVCGKTYIKSYSEQKTCSRACGSANRHPPALRSCKYCGKSFHGSRMQVYCSPECSKAYARRERIRLIEHRDARRRKREAEEETERSQRIRSDSKNDITFDKIMRYMVKHDCQYAKAYQAVKNGEE